MSKGVVAPVIFHNTGKILTIAKPPGFLMSLQLTASHPTIMGRVGGMLLAMGVLREQAVRLADEYY